MRWLPSEAPAVSQQTSSPVELKKKGRERSSFRLRRLVVVTVLLCSVLQVGSSYRKLGRVCWLDSRHMAPKPRERSPSYSYYTEESDAEMPAPKAEAAAKAAASRPSRPAAKAASGVTPVSSGSASSSSEERGRSPARAHNRREDRQPSPPREECKGKGKKGKAPKCQYCWYQPRNWSEASLSQHQFWSLDCNTWRLHKEEGLPWDQARNAAWELKEQRAREYANEDGTATAEPVAPAPSRKRRDELLKGREKKEKAKKRKKLKKASSPSPPAKPHHKHHRPPPSPDSEGEVTELAKRLIRAIRSK